MSFFATEVPGPSLVPQSILEDLVDGLGDQLREAIDDFPENNRTWGTPIELGRHPVGWATPSAGPLPPRLATTSLPPALRGPLSPGEEGSETLWNLNQRGSLDGLRIVSAPYDRLTLLLERIEASLGHMGPSPLVSPSQGPQLPFRPQMGQQSSQGFQRGFENQYMPMRGPMRLFSGLEPMAFGEGGSGNSIFGGMGWHSRLPSTDGRFHEDDGVIPQVLPKREGPRGGNNPNGLNVGQGGFQGGAPGSQMHQNGFMAPQNNLSMAPNGFTGQSIPQPSFKGPSGPFTMFDTRSNHPFNPQMAQLPPININAGSMPPPHSRTSSLNHSRNGSVSQLTPTGQFLAHPVEPPTQTTNTNTSSTPVNASPEPDNRDPAKFHATLVAKAIANEAKRPGKPARAPCIRLRLRMTTAQLAEHERKNATMKTMFSQFNNRLAAAAAIVRLLFDEIAATHKQLQPGYANALALRIAAVAPHEFHRLETTNQIIGDLLNEWLEKISASLDELDRAKSLGLSSKDPESYTMVKNRVLEQVLVYAALAGAVWQLRNSHVIQFDWLASGWHRNAPWLVRLLQIDDVDQERSAGGLLRDASPDTVSQSVKDFNRYLGLCEHMLAELTKLLTLGSFDSYSKNNVATGEKVVFTEVTRTPPRFTHHHLVLWTVLTPEPEVLLRHYPQDASIVQLFTHPVHHCPGNESQKLTHLAIVGFNGNEMPVGRMGSLAIYTINSMYACSTCHQLDHTKRDCPQARKREDELANGFSGLSVSTADTAAGPVTFPEWAEGSVGSSGLLFDLLPLPNGRQYLSKPVSERLKAAKVPSSVTDMYHWCVAATKGVFITHPEVADDVDVLVLIRQAAKKALESKAEAAENEMNQLFEVPELSESQKQLDAAVVQLLDLKTDLVLLGKLELVPVSSNLVLLLSRDASVNPYSESRSFYAITVEPLNSESTPLSGPSFLLVVQKPPLSSSTHVIVVEIKALNVGDELPEQIVNSHFDKCPGARPQTWAVSEDLALSLSLYSLFFATVAYEGEKPPILEVYQGSRHSSLRTLSTNQFCTACHVNTHSRFTCAVHPCRICKNGSKHSLRDCPARSPAP